MHVCEVSHYNDDCLCKNNVMHATTVRCERKLKRCFYKLIYIKMTTNAHWNQVDNTHMKKNIKSDRNVAWDMKSGLAPKQLSWMWWWILDAMWDIRATRSMRGISSAMSGWWVSINRGCDEHATNLGKMTLGGRFLKWSLHVISSY